MMQAPVYKNRVQDEGPERVRRSPIDPGPAYKAAAINEEGSKQIARGAFALSEGIQKMADDANAAAVNAAYSEYVTKSTDLLYNADKGFMNASGAGAEGLGVKTMEAHKKLQSEISGRLNGRQQTLFTNAITGYDSSTARSVMIQEGKAMAEYRKTEAIKVLDANSIAWAKDPDNFSMEAQEDAIRAAAIGIYGNQGEEQNIKNTDAVRSKYVASTVLRMAADNPIKAQEWAAKNEKLMDPADAEDVKLKLDKAVMPVKAQNVAEDMFKKYGLNGRSEAVDYIRANYSGEEESTFLQSTEGLYIDKKQAENEIETQKYDAMYGKIRRKSGGYQSLRKEINSLTGVDEVTRFGLFDLLDREYKVDRSGTGGSGGEGAGGMYKTDPATYYKIEDMIDNKTIFDTAPDWTSFRALYKAKLSPTKMQEYGKRLYKNADGSDAPDPSIKLQETSLYDKLMNDEKITDPAVRARAIDRYNYEMGEAERSAAKQGKTISYEDRVAVMQKILAPEVVGKTKTFWGRPTDKTRRRFEIPPEAEMRGGVWYFPDASGKWIRLVFEDE